MPALRARLAWLEENRLLPEGVRLLPVADQSVYIRQSIKNLTEQALHGSALAALVILIFLRNVTATLIVSVAIPLSILVTFIVMYFTDQTLNIFTLGGLALGIGRLVDDSIVDIENIYRRLKENRRKPNPENPLKVVYLASTEVRNSIVYATLIVTFGFQVARVEGQSMAPTLADQDRLIVNKLAYRISDPQRGDIVMLYYPLNPEKSFVKRVIAEEGDTVRVVDGRVYVNDVPIPDNQVPPEYRSHDDWGPQVIPEGYYFVMGDHRNNSSDSRHWGFVPKKYIIGKVQLRWWPVPTATIF